MSLAEQLEAKGKEIRNIEIAEKLLAERVELAFIAKIKSYITIPSIKY